MAMLALCECSLGKGSINTLTSLAILGHFPVSPDQHIITQYYSTAHSTHNTQHYSVSKLQIQQLSLGLMGRRHLVSEQVLERYLHAGHVLLATVVPVRNMDGVSGRYGE